MDILPRLRLPKNTEHIEIVTSPDISPNLEKKKEVRRTVKYGYE